MKTDKSPKIPDVKSREYVKLTNNGSPMTQSHNTPGEGRCDSCDWTFGCFDESQPCRKKPTPSPSPEALARELTEEIIRNVGGLREWPASQKQVLRNIIMPFFAPLREELAQARRERDGANQRAGAYCIDLAQICADNDIKALPSQQPRFIGEHLAALRAQSARDAETIKTMMGALTETKSTIYACITHLGCDPLHLREACERINAALAARTPSTGQEGKKP